MDEKNLQVRHYGLNICASEALWMELCEIVDITGYLACRIAGRGILDENILGEALSWVEGLYKGIPHYLPFQIPELLKRLLEKIDNSDESS